MFDSEIKFVELSTLFTLMREWSPCKWMLCADCGEIRHRPWNEFEIASGLTYVPAFGLNRVPVLEQDGRVVIALGHDSAHAEVDNRYLRTHRKPVLLLRRRSAISFCSAPDNAHARILPPEDGICTLA